MVTLVLIYSLKSMYNHNVDSIIVPNLKVPLCQALGTKITQDLKHMNPILKLTFTVSKHG